MRLLQRLDFSKHGFDSKRIMRISLLIICDAAILNFASFLALWIRFEFHLDILLSSSEYVFNILKFAPFYTAIGIITFTLFRLYTSLWEFASVNEFIRIVFACAITDCSGFALMRIMNIGIPRSHVVINGLVLVILIMGVRFSYRLLGQGLNLATNRKRTMIIGAGNAGVAAMHEFARSSHSQNRVVCIIDDDKTKHGSHFHGVKIIGGRDKIVAAANKYAIDEIILAIPYASNAIRKDIINICQQTSCRLKTLPSITQLTNGDVDISNIRNVEIEDLLGRNSVTIDLSDIMSYVNNRVVLVTGGGGSIGSELCRQIASYHPKVLIIFDIYENNAYDIQLELLKQHPGLDLKTLIGSVRDKDRIDKIFCTYRPELVFHAAAHKHVPLMEDSPNEAVKNNVFGTLNVALAADKYGAKRMLLISTDKAVNPTNVMGASKRICEMIVQAMDIRSKTEYVAVRFGNVLGSNGSVIPLFRKQIENGGPVTVTHKDIVRYFMTIPEAVSLVLQAGVYANGGEIFVLDMGKPVRIDDLARNMIKLSGFEPDVDIPIVYTGLRPGEKLYEELLLDEENMKKTDNELIYIAHKIEFDEELFERNIEKLREMCDSDSDGIRDIVKEIVKEYNYSKIK